MKKLSYLIVLALILGLVLTGCLLSNVGQVPTSEQSGITYLTKGVPLPINLVGLWRFNEGIGTIAYDNSGYGNDGTLMGGTSWTSGKFGNALSFDGDGDYVQLPASNTILNTDTFTIEAWFKTSVNHPAYGGTEGRIVNLARDAAGFSAVALYVEENNIAVCYRTTTEFKHLKHTVDYHDDVWHHIAVTRDATTTYRLYYDGAEVASQTDTFYGFGTSVAYLGTFNSSERFFNGTIDEVRIWNTALTADQLILYDDYSGLLAPYKEPPKAFKSGSSIPLKWQYKVSDTVVNSSTANPSIEIKSVEGNGEPIEGDPIVADDPGSSGYHYDSENNTWHFNWQTEGYDAGDYNIYIINDWTGQTFGPCPIKLR